MNKPFWIDRDSPNEQEKPGVKNKNVTAEFPVRIAEPTTNLMSLSSADSSYYGQNKLSLFQEIQLLYEHFGCLKTYYFSAHRLMDSEAIEDIIVNSFLHEVRGYIKEINGLFDDLEFAKNTSNEENLKKQEFSKMFKSKENIFSRLSAMHRKLMLIFEAVFEKQHFKEVERQKIINIEDELERKRFELPLFQQNKKKVVDNQKMEYLEEQLRSTRLELSLQQKKEKAADKEKIKSLEQDLQSSRLELSFQQKKEQDVDKQRVKQLEEELKGTRLELALLQQKNKQETDRLLERIKELQDSLDLKTAQFDILQNYVQLLKSSFLEKFGDT